MSVDPLSSKYPSLSPYNYTLNNPINNFDPDGRAAFGASIGTIMGGVSAYNRAVELNGGTTKGKGMEIAFATIAGALAGGIAGGIDMTDGWAIITGGIAVGAGELAAQYFITGEIDGGKIGQTVTLGFVGGAAGKYLIKYMPILKRSLTDQLGYKPYTLETLLKDPRLINFGEAVFGAVLWNEIVKALLADENNENNENNNNSHNNNNENTSDENDDDNKASKNKNNYNSWWNGWGAEYQDPPR